MMLPAGVSAWIESTTQEPVPVVGDFVFGRAKEASVWIDSPKASRRHAAIHAQRRAAGIEYWMIDLGSGNGTFLNERRVVRPAQLHDGDHVRIADHEFTFRMNSVVTENNADEASLATMLDSRTGPGWLLVADIMDSTPLVRRMPADQLATKLGHWVRVCTEAIETGGGVINQYLGDGFLAYWTGGTDATDNVVATILKLREEQARAELPFRFVLHYGEFTITTEPAQGVESLLAPAVHYVFRSEKVAGTAGAASLFTTPAGEAFGARLPLVRLPGDFELKGFEGRHEFFTLGD
jgi:adenylate cyclase